MIGNRVRFVGLKDFKVFFRSAYFEMEERRKTTCEFYFFFSFHILVVKILMSALKNFTTLKFATGK